MICQSAQLYHNAVGLGGLRHHILDEGHDLPMKRGNFGGKDMPADLSPLVMANALICRQRCGGITARGDECIRRYKGVANTI